jgi:hypothetical protein
MSTGGNPEFISIDRPTVEQVIGRMRDVEACEAKPLTEHCLLAGTAASQYRVAKMADKEVCRTCPVYAKTRQKLITMAARS